MEKEVTIKVRRGWGILDVKRGVADHARKFGLGVTNQGRKLFIEGDAKQVNRFLTDLKKSGLGKRIS